jgi:hypothetical protein
MTDHTDKTLNPYAVPAAVADDVIRAADEGRIINKAWRGGSRGKEMVCALAAFGPNINSARDCPAEYMPSWLAELIPALDDGLPDDQIGAFARGLGERAKRWHVIDADGWDRVRVGFLSYLIQSALEEAEKVQPTPPPDCWGQVQTACNRVLDALNGNGDLVAAEAAAWSAARAAAEAAAAAAGVAARAAAEVAAWAAWAAGVAAGAAAEAAAAAARYDARAAARAAAYQDQVATLFALLDAEISK